MKFISYLFLKLLGWGIKGEVPVEKKYLIIVAPHTSNWDFPICVAINFYHNLQCRWFGKHTIFKGPWGYLFKKWGGIPVKRHKSEDLVSQIIEEFNANDRFVFALSPEGTRSFVDRWKTGFYYIAHGAKAPILPVAIDAEAKRLVLFPLFQTTGDELRDIEQLQKIFSPYSGINPSNKENKKP